MKVLAVYATKGGVGKTSTAVNLAWIAADSGLRVLLWDLDPQGASSYLLRVKPKVKGGAQALVSGARDGSDAVKGSDFPGLDILPADFSFRNLDLELDEVKNPAKRLRKILKDFQDDYDLVILDCPPSVSLSSESMVYAADVMAVPLVPASLSARTADQLSSFVSSLDGPAPILVGFFSMADKRRTMHRDIMESLPERHSWMSSIAIPSAAAVEQMGARRAPLMCFAGNSPAADAYRDLWAALRAELEPEGA